eukprot:IDg8976t1
MRPLRQDFSFSCGTSTPSEFFVPPNRWAPKTQLPTSRSNVTGPNNDTTEQDELVFAFTPISSSVCIADESLLLPSPVRVEMISRTILFEQKIRLIRGYDAEKIREHPRLASRNYKHDRRTEQYWSFRRIVPVLIDEVNAAGGPRAVLQWKEREVKGCCVRSSPFDSDGLREYEECASGDFPVSAVDLYADSTTLARSGAQSACFIRVRAANVHECSTA